MIPDFNENGELPEGIHLVNLGEIKERFCFNERRNYLFINLLKVINEIKSVDGKVIYIDGSFISNKENPSDIDICWGEKEQLKEEFMLDALSKSPKLMFHGFQSLNIDCFHAYTKVLDSKSNLYYLDFFQKSKNTDFKKGILQINI